MHGFLESSLAKSEKILNSPGDKRSKDYSDENSSSNSNTNESKKLSGFQTHSFYSKSNGLSGSRGNLFVSKATSGVFPKTYSKQPQSSLTSRSYPPEKDGRRRVLATLPTQQTSHLKNDTEPRKSMGRISTSSLYKLPPTIVESFEIGFPNQGLTCYLNSVLQGLLGVSNFVSDLLKFHEEIKIFPTDGTTASRPKGLFSTFCRLAFLKEKGRQDDISNALNQLKTALVKSNPQFEGAHMQDAHEFLITFCNTFENETMEFQKQQQKDVSINPILTNFGFKFEETKKCARCSHEATKVTSDFILKLASPVSVLGRTCKPNPNRLDCLLKRTLNSGHEMHCEHCDSKGNTMHSLSEKFVLLPKCLILYLPRTRYSIDGDSIKFEKNRDCVEISEFISLDAFMSDNAQVPQMVENSPIKASYLKRQSSTGQTFGESPVKKIRISDSESPQNMSIGSDFGTPPKTSPPNFDLDYSFTRETEFSTNNDSLEINRSNISGDENGNLDCHLESSLLNLDDLIGASPNLNPRKTSKDERSKTPKRILFAKEDAAIAGAALQNGDHKSKLTSNPVELDDIFQESRRDSNVSNYPADDYMSFDSPEKFANNPLSKFNGSRSVLDLISPPASPQRSIDDNIWTTETPTKLKNLTASEIELLSEADSLELAMRQSIKESSSKKRSSLEMPPIGMSEDEQIAQAIQISLVENHSPSQQSIRDEDQKQTNSISKMEDGKTSSHESDESTLSGGSDNPEPITDDDGPDGARLSVPDAEGDTTTPATSRRGCYRLIGVVSHLGGSYNVNSGHYVADVYSHKVQAWYRYDDLRVSNRRLSDVISDNARDAYLFIYKFQN